MRIARTWGASAAIIATLAAGAFASTTAQANIAFADSGVSGTLAAASETWFLGSAAPPAGTFGWGSPGVNLGITAYGQAIPATNFEIFFEGFDLSTAQIAIGDGAGCAGTDSGGTTFCDVSSGTQWTASPLGTNGIAFFAPAGESLTFGELYFVNIFLVGNLPDSIAFDGFWSTNVPEPASIALFGAGLAGLGAVRRRRKAKA